MKDAVFSAKLIKKNGKLTYVNAMMQIQNQSFVDALEEGQVVEMFFEAHKEDGTKPQLAKIHVYIRKLATELGYTFNEMKLTIKRQAGLSWKTNGVEQTKSFGECSKEELGLVIDALNEAGESVNITF